MKVCKLCGEIAKPNTWQEGFYCDICGNLSFDEVYSEIDIYKEWLDYRYLCMTPEEIREMKGKLLRLC